MGNSPPAFFHLWVLLTPCFALSRPPLHIPDGLNITCGTSPWQALPSPSPREDIYLAGLLPMTGVWPGGSAMLASIELALDIINARPDILQNHRLNVIYGDTEFKIYEGTRLLHKLLEEAPVQLVTIGAANSELTGHSALLSDLYNMVQISYASVSPVLSDKSTYPRLFRTSAPDTTVNPARIAVCKEFGWNNVAVIHQARLVFDAVADDLKKSIEEDGMNVITAEVFQLDPTPQIANLKKHDARIIFAICNKDRALILLCKAYRAGMVGSHYVWFFPGWFDDLWWEKIDSTIDCTLAEMREAAEGYMAAGDVSLNPSSHPGVSHLIPSQYLAQYNERTNTEKPFGSNLAPQAFDAMFAVALALHSTDKELQNTGYKKRLEDWTRDAIDVTEMLHAHLRAVEFNGIKSHIKFNSNQDPIIIVKIERVQNGVRSIYGYYQGNYTNNSHVVWSADNNIQWESGHPPVDALETTTESVFVSEVAYISLSILASLGIVLASALLAVNIYFRNNKDIKMSSPNINNVILLGCMCVYVTIFLQELDQSTVIIYCKLRTYSITIGFGLAFGALFSKTWRIHLIFANKKLKKKVIKDRQLMAIIATILGINLIVLLVWTIIDERELRSVIIDQQMSADGDTLTVYERLICHSRYSHYFTYTLYVIQGLILLFGTFLSWETRKVKIAALNDSQLIGLCVYNVVILSVMGVVMASVLNDKITLQYCLVSAVLLMATTMTQCIIFVPKLLKLREGRIISSEDPIRTGVSTVVSHGLTTCSFHQPREGIAEILNQSNIHFGSKSAPASKIETPKSQGVTLVVGGFD